MTFEEWFGNNKEEVVDNCDNRMDEYDAEYWLERAFAAGWNSSNKYSGEPQNETTET
jgi:hypothetical protein